jgi:hypothetical protein
VVGAVLSGIINQAREFFWNNRCKVMEADHEGHGDDI